MYEIIVIRIVSVDLYIRENGPLIQQMIGDDVEPCKLNFVEYLRIFRRIQFICSCMLYSLVVFQIAPRFRLTKCVISRVAGCIVANLINSG